MIFSLNVTKSSPKSVLIYMSESLNFETTKGIKGDICATLRHLQVLPNPARPSRCRAIHDFRRFTTFAVSVVDYLKHHWMEPTTMRFTVGIIIVFIPQDFMHSWSSSIWDLPLVPPPPHLMLSIFKMGEIQYFSKNNFIFNDLVEAHLNEKALDEKSSSN